MCTAKHRHLWKLSSWPCLCDTGSVCGWHMQTPSIIESGSCFMGNCNVTKILKFHDCQLFSLCDWYKQITSLKVDPIIRGGIRRFTDMIGQLWCSLADYYIRAGHFEKVRAYAVELMILSSVFALKLVPVLSWGWNHLTVMRSYH